MSLNALATGPNTAESSQESIKDMIAVIGHLFGRGLKLGRVARLAFKIDHLRAQVEVHALELISRPTLGLVGYVGVGVLYGAGQGAWG